MSIKYTINIIGTEIFAGVIAYIDVSNHHVGFLNAVFYFLLWWFIGFIIWDIIDVVYDYIHKRK